MNAPHDLRDVLADRAARTPSAPDVNEVLTAVRHRADERARRTRNLRAAGGGAFGVAAAVALLIVVVPSGGHSTQPGGPAPSSTPHSSSTPQSGKQRIAAEKRAARSAAASRARAAATAGSAAANAPMLVKVPPAPAKAQTSIDLIPSGWVYLGHQHSYTQYGPAARKADLGDFTDTITVNVHARMKPDGAHPLTVAGYQASYRDYEGTQTVDVIYSNKVDIDIQIWSNAHTTRAQALKIASTIDVRSIKIRSHG